MQKNKILITITESDDESEVKTEDAATNEAEDEADDDADDDAEEISSYSAGYEDSDTEQLIPEDEDCDIKYTEEDEVYENAPDNIDK